MKLIALQSVESVVSVKKLTTAVLAFLLGAVTASAQETEPISTSLVPLVGTIRGVGDVRWRTDVRIFNRTANDVDVILVLPAMNDAFLATSVPANGALVFGDIAAEAFGLEEALSPLYVHAISTKPLDVAATITGEGPNGGVAPQSPRTLLSKIFPPRATLTNLAVSDDFRTNIGLVNLEARAMTVTLALQRVSGRNLATKRLDLAPSSLVQVAMNDLFPMITKGDDFILVAEFSAPGAYAYASVLRNDTHAGQFVGP